jgi:hypothetical protein
VVSFNVVVTTAKCSCVDDEVLWRCGSLTLRLRLGVRGR